MLLFIQLYSLKSSRLFTNSTPLVQTIYNFNFGINYNDYRILLIVVSEFLSDLKKIKMFGVNNVFVIMMVPLIASVFGVSNGAAQPSVVLKEVFEVTACDRNIGLSYIIDQAKTTILDVPNDCPDHAKTIILPSYTDAKKIGRSAVVSNHLKSQSIYFFSENNKVITKVDAQHKIELMFENGWDLISPEEAENEIKQRHLTLAAMDTHNAQMKYFSLNSNGLAASGVFTSDFVYEIISDSSHPMRIFYLHLVPASTENALVKFSNKSPNTIVVVVKNKYSINIENGKTLYFKNNNGWNYMIEKLNK